MRIGKEDFVLIDIKSGNIDKSNDAKKSGDKKSGGGSDPVELEDAQSGKISAGKKDGPGYERSADGKGSTSKKTHKMNRPVEKSIPLGGGGNKEKVEGKWKKALAGAMAGSGSKLSDKAKRIIASITSKKGKVNWKKELKRFMNKTFGAFAQSLPNRRFIAQDKYLYGQRKVGVDAMDKVVVAVDTSASVSKAQIRTFIEEVWHLTKKVQIKELIIIYCSTRIQEIDRVKYGQTPDFTKIVSGGGTSFDPPFAWVENQKITPAAFIYMTDTGASYPDVKQYGITKYQKKVFWFVCIPDLSYMNTPTFGQYVHIPIDDKGNFS